jgi:hypothetical protein
MAAQHLRNTHGLADRDIINVQVRTEKQESLG